LGSSYTDVVLPDKPGRLIIGLDIVHGNATS
jgi:hypothetical protein